MRGGRWREGGEKEGSSVRWFHDVSRISGVDSSDSCKKPRGCFMSVNTEPEGGQNGSISMIGNLKCHPIRTDNIFSSETTNQLILYRFPKHVLFATGDHFIVVQSTVLIKVIKSLSTSQLSLSRYRYCGPCVPAPSQGGCPC